MLKRSVLVWVAIIVLAMALAGCQAKTEQAPRDTAKAPESKEIVLATTTSTQDSGLLDVLIPYFEKKTGYKVKPIAVGTGQALEQGKKGDADVLLTHAMSSEKPLVDEGVAVNYQLVMHNDFILVGPENDPAGVKQAGSSIEALKKIAEKGAVFVSRGDKSGTDTKEKSMWKTAQIDPKGKQWYQETGSGMGQTLTIANQKLGYTLTDRATFLAQQKNLKLVIVSEGDKDLLNIYHVMQVNPDKFARVNGAGGKAFVEYMVSPETQKIIEDFGKDKYGQSLFYPDAGKKVEELGK
ncbi:MAG: tungsten ABC transporter substrate-binding protein [Peptococcaceae bacterium BICA1-7]|nr:MAG: tungsten ABC transporter substrate-binding protein [Peptococcaceae bacterium BICA1-7]HBV95506.1 tungsten ABC transporter substrate-binding protein [Desulfotomaculum sp.]